MAGASAVSRGTLEGMAKILEAFFKVSPSKTVAEVAEHIATKGGDDVLKALGDLGTKQADEVAQALEKELAQTAGKGGAKSARRAATEVGEGLEKSAREALDKAVKKGKGPGGKSYLDHILDELGMKLDEPVGRWHGHHVPFKDYGAKKFPQLHQQLRDVQSLLLKNGIDPIYGKECLMVAVNAGHNPVVQKEILDSLEDGFRKGGKRGLEEALEQAKKRFVPPYPKLVPR